MSDPLLIGGLITLSKEKKTKYRDYMEDYSFTNEIKLPNMKESIAIFGICDGHGGSEVSEYISKNMNPIISNGFSLFTDSNQFLDKVLVSKIIKNCFHNLEINLEKEYPGVDSGSTCAMVLSIKNINTFYAINCGDSSVFGLQYNHSAKEVRVIRLTDLHKPDETDEKRRILESGGYVQDIAGVPRLNGNLAVSRSFGDIEFRKHGMTELPEIVGPLSFSRSYIASNDKNYIGFLITSDGITDYISIDKIQNLLAENFQNRYNISNLLMKNTPNAMDNASVISAFI